MSNDPRKIHYFGEGAGRKLLTACGREARYVERVTAKWDQVDCNLCHRRRGEDAAQKRAIDLAPSMGYSP